MKKLTEKELNQLNFVLSEVGVALMGRDSYDIKTVQEDNKIIITITEKDYQPEFEAYLKTLDDDIFIEACESYMRLTGQDLSKIKTITPKLIKDFKRIVSDVVLNKINAMRTKYGL